MQFFSLSPFVLFSLLFLLFYTSQFTVPTPNSKNQGPVWWVSLNNVVWMFLIYVWVKSVWKCVLCCLKCVILCLSRAAKQAPSLLFSLFYPYIDFPSQFAPLHLSLSLVSPFLCLSQNFAYKSLIKIDHSALRTSSQWLGPRFKVSDTQPNQLKGMIIVWLC